MRRESVAAIFLVVLCASVVGGACVWSDDHPAQSTWMWRIGLSVAAVVSIAVFIRLQFWRKGNLAPDFLSAKCKTFSEQNGLCFTLYTTNEDGICFINAMFQNRYERPCKARIALRPVAGVFRSAVGPFRNGFSTMVFDISCGPGAFGIAGIPLPISSSRQGKQLTMQIGASVDYPEGKGKALRFSEGALIRYDAEFQSAYLSTLRALYLICGGLMFTFPPTVTFRLPTGVAESVPEGQDQRIQILWTLGDEEVTTIQ